MHILQKVKEWQTLYDEKIEQCGFGFNIFELMNKERDEVCLHSAFIANLLNPHGSHNMGNRFLKKFIQSHDLDFNCNGVEVLLEHYIGHISPDETRGGRIDILIKNRKNEKILIENKIDAPDQKYQLLRYYNEYKDAQILYLTLFGDEPHEKSTESETKCLIKNEHFKCISYQSDIINWIESVIEEESHVPTLFTSTCRQYINTLKKLTHQPLLKNMDAELNQIVRRNLKESIEIESAISKVKSKIQIEFWDSLRKYLNYGLKEKELPLVGKSVNPSIVDNYYNTAKRSEKDFGIYFDICELEDGYKLRMGCFLEHNVYYAFLLIKEDKIVNDNNIFRHYRDVLIETGSYETSDTALGWQYTDPKLNFYEFNSEEVLTLADTESIEKTTRYIAKRMIEEACMIKERLMQIESLEIAFK